MADVHPVLDMFTNQNPKDHEVSSPFLSLLIPWFACFYTGRFLSCFLQFYLVLFYAIPSFSFVPLILSFDVCCFKLFSFQNALYKENYT